MSRTPRVISATGIYHVMMRGINHQIIFRDDQDYRFFPLIYETFFDESR